MRSLRLVMRVVSLAWLCVASTWSDRAEAAPVVDRTSPSTGQVGHILVVQGRGLRGADLKVTFGRAEALGALNPGGSDRVIEVLVPNKVDPRDPDTVPITVVVDGVEAIASAPPLQFTYEVPQPAAGLADYTTGDPDHPKSVVASHPFVLSLTGLNFLIARRAPQRCLVVDPHGQVAEAEVMTDSVGDAHVSCSFAGVEAAGDYELLLAFSDGSGASILAPGFVLAERPIFGDPPSIESVAFGTNPQEIVECDFTEAVEGYFCTLGIPGIRAEPGIFIGGTFTSVRFRARVTDPNSTPTLSNVLLVAASFADPDTPTERSLVLLDDGSANTFPFPQKADLPEDCIVDASGICQCVQKVYRVDSGDVVPRDDVYTRDMAFVDRGTLQAGLLQDCIMRQSHDTPLPLAAGSTLEFKIEAVDREGDLSVWPARLRASVGAGSFSCTGDECGCCLLTSMDPAAECKGKPGMPSDDFPAGVCVSIF